MARRGGMVKLSFQAGKGFKRTIGKALGKGGGRVRPKTFWLGHDRVAAQIFALRALAEWKSVRAAGGTVWTDEALRRVGDAKRQRASASTPSTPQPPPAIAAAPAAATVPNEGKRQRHHEGGHPRTVQHATDAYLDGIRQRCEAGQASYSHHTSQGNRLKRVAEVLGPDRPLDAVGEAELSQAVLTLCRRPTVPLVSGTSSASPRAMDGKTWQGPRE